MDKSLDKYTSLLLKEFVKNSLNDSDFLSEQKNEVDPGEYASLDDIAILVDPARYSVTYVVYKPKYYADKIKKEISDAIKRYKKIPFKGKFQTFEDFFNFENIRSIFKKDPVGIVGFLVLVHGRAFGPKNSCNRANEIMRVSAKKGYETFMFDIALVKHSPVMPNRRRISDNSIKIWNYLNKERKDLDKKFFKDEMAPHKKTEQDCEVYHHDSLDKSYKKKQSAHIQNLINKHKLFLSQMEKFLDDNGVDFIKSRIVETMVDAGELFHEIKDEGGWETKPKEDLDL